LATRIRLKRIGSRGNPFYRIDVFDAHSPRDGKSLETLGTYDPRAEKDADKTQLKRDRVVYWLDLGATPTETVRNLFKKSGIHT
jgi:small subunit ribosomal protein S16